MNPYLVAALAIVAIVVVLAFLSDRRDRRNAVDPKLRADALVERRRQLRKRRVDAITRRRMGDRTAGDAPPTKPWER